MQWRDALFICSSVPYLVGQLVYAFPREALTERNEFVFLYGFLFATKWVVRITIKSSSYRECDPSELIGLFQ